MRNISKFILDCFDPVLPMTTPSVKHQGGHEKYAAGEKMQNILEWDMMTFAIWNVSWNDWRSNGMSDGTTAGKYRHMRAMYFTAVVLITAIVWDSLWTEALGYTVLGRRPTSIRNIIFHLWVKPFYYYCGLHSMLPHAVSNQVDQDIYLGLH